MLPTLEDARKLFRDHHLFVVCGSCPRFHEGMALGLGRCTGRNCGGLVDRKDYPEYAGSIKDFSALCMICGSEEVFAFAKVEESDRKFGLCMNHLEVLDQCARPSNGILREDKRVFIFPNPARVLPEFNRAAHII